MSRRVLAAACGLAAAAGVAFAPPARADHGVPIDVLMVGNRIVTVSSAAPGAALGSVVVGGLQLDETLVGIDYRPADGALYGVGRGSATTGIYTIVDGEATRLATLNVGGVPIVLDGSSFGVDFNPAANALRIVSDTGQNLRVTPAGLGTPGVAATGATAVDGTLSSTGVAGAAYTNNDFEPGTTATTGVTGTRLYDIDAQQDRLVVQDPPNNGVLATVGSGLGIDVTSAVGFDIRSEIGDDGLAVAGQDVAYALVTGAKGRPVVQLVTIDLAAGTATPIGALGQYRGLVIGMAVALDR